MNIVDITHHGKIIAEKQQELLDKIIEFKEYININAFNHYCTIGLYNELEDCEILIKESIKKNLNNRNKAKVIMTFEIKKGSDT